MYPRNAEDKVLGGLSPPAGKHSIDTLNDKAFGKEIEKYRTQLYWRAYELTRSYDDAQDLVQDTLARAYEKRNLFIPQQDNSFLLWAKSIMFNLFVNNYRQTQHRGIPESLDAILERNERELPDNGRPDTEQTAFDRITCEKIRAAIGILPNEYRAVVRLADLEESSYQEIADQLGIPIGTVRSRVSRGREIVRNAKGVREP